MVSEYGYEYDAELDKEVWAYTKDRTVTDKLNGAYCLRSGRDALKAIAREYKPCIVLMPALACDSMISPFRKFGHEIKYYKLKPDYSIDINSLDTEDSPILFLYMDYFGVPSISDFDLFKMKAERNIVFIEDRTHTLPYARRLSFQPDYVIASLRKWLPIPDGGLLWGHISQELKEDLTFSLQRLEAQIMRHSFLINGDVRIKTEFRKIFSSVSELLDNDEPCAMSSYSFELARKTDLELLRDVRMKNAAALMEILKSSPNISLIQDKPGVGDLYVAFNVNNRDEVQRRLSEKGIFNTIIWPLNEKQRLACDVARFTEASMLAAPCDQRYSVEDMMKIGNEIVKVVSNVNR